MDKEELFAKVRANTSRAQALDALGYAARFKEASEDTRSGYMKIARRRLSDPSISPMEGVSARSWHATRAAILATAGEAYRAARKSCDEAQRAGDLSLAMEAATDASGMLDVIERTLAAERPASTAPRKTKRRSLPRTPGWQARVFEAASPAQRAGIAVLWATGCRPAEIEDGVDLRLVRLKDGREVIHAHVPGAKVTAITGQPRRVLAIATDTEAGKALLSIMAGRAELTVQRSASRLRKDTADIMDRSGLGWAVSPYSFRHQQAAELKATMPDAAEVAAALGHRTTRSQSRYGTVAQATGRGSIIAAKAVRPVRETRPEGGIKPSIQDQPKGPE